MISMPFTCQIPKPKIQQSDSSKNTWSRGGGTLRKTHAHLDSKDVQTCAETGVSDHVAAMGALPGETAELAHPLRAAERGSGGIFIKVALC